MEKAAGHQMNMSHLLLRPLLLVDQGYIHWLLRNQQHPRDRSSQRIRDILNDFSFIDGHDLGAKEQSIWEAAEDEEVSVTLLKASERHLHDVNELQDDRSREDVADEGGIVGYAQELWRCDAGDGFWWNTLDECPERQQGRAGVDLQNIPKTYSETQESLVLTSDSVRNH